MLKRLFAILAITTLLPIVGYAEHEADHRYTMRGYVLDANERAISGVSVRVKYGVRVVGNATTDSGGYYSILMHLHDTDLGRTLSVLAGKDKGDVRVKLTAGDRRTVRIHNVNFVDGTVVEGEMERFRVPAWAYLVIGFALVASVFVYMEKLRKKKLRQISITEASSEMPHKPKKRKRKRR